MVIMINMTELFLLCLPNLDPGFEVESGAIFHAFIDGCGGQ